MPYPTDITRVDVDITYGLSSEPELLVNPLVEAFILRTADAVKDSIVVTYHGDSFLVRLDNYADVDYVILHHLTAKTSPAVSIDVLWVDDTSGDSGSTQLGNAETMIIPNPMIRDDDLGFGGIRLSTQEVAGVSLQVIVVGKKQ